MSKNISKLSGRIGLKNNLFQKLSDRSLNSKNGEGMKELAEKYHVGVSTIHGAESFYEFLRPAHREKKAFVCNGSACMLSLIHISEPTRRTPISYAVFCLKKNYKKNLAKIKWEKCFV